MGIGLHPPPPQTLPPSLPHLAHTPPNPQVQLLASPHLNTSLFSRGLVVTCILLLLLLRREEPKPATPFGHCCRLLLLLPPLLLLLLLFALFTG